MRADNKIRELAEERSDANILVITSNDLIAKEAFYHFTCYRDYSRSSNKKQSEDKDDGLSDVLKHLNNLREHPTYLELKSLQSMMAHYQDLVHLKKDFPDIYKKFENGNFSVQLSPDNPFGRMESDKVIETTINKVTKTPGGTTGKLKISGSSRMNNSN